MRVDAEIQRRGLHIDSQARTLVLRRIISRDMRMPLNLCCRAGTFGAPMTKVIGVFATLWSASRRWRFVPSRTRRARGHWRLIQRGAAAERSGYGVDVNRQDALGQGESAGLTVE